MTLCVRWNLLEDGVTTDIGGAYKVIFKPSVLIPSVEVR